MLIPTELHKSGLMQAETCLFAADQYWNHGVEKQTSEPMEFGTWAHDRWRVLCDREETPESVLASCKTPDEIQIIENILQYDPYLSPDAEVVVLPELNIALDKDFVIADGRETWWGGTLDQAVIGQHELCVVDGKSGWGLKESQTEMNMYAVLFAAWFRAYEGINVDCVNFTYFHFRSGRRIQHLIWCGEARRLLMVLRQELEAAAPVPMPGAHCQWCQFCGTICPLGMTTLPVTTGNIPVEIVRSYLTTGSFLPEHAPVLGLAKIFLEEQAAKIGKALKTHVAGHGPVAIGDSEFALSERDGDKWDHGKVAEIIGNAGVPQEDLANVLTISKRTATKLKDKYPRVYADLFRYARIEGKPTTELVLRKKQQ
jgi:ferredoxin